MEIPQTKRLSNKNPPFLFSVTDYLIFLCILLIGFFLRSYNLKSLSLWIDEFVTTYKLYQPVNYSDFFSLLNLYHSDQIPLSHLIYFSIFRIFSISPSNIELLRWISVFIGMLNLIILFLFVKTSFNRKIALWATLLFALSPFHIIFSQMIRPYIFYEFAGLCSILSTVLLFKKFTHIRIWFWIIANIFLLVSHYTGFILISIEVFLLTFYYLKTRKWSFLLIIILTCILLFFTPKSIQIYTKEDDFIMGIPSLYKWLTDLFADDAILTNEPFFHQGQSCFFISPYWMNEIVNLHLWFDTILIALSIFSILYVLRHLYLEWKNVPNKNNSFFIFLFWAITSQPIISFLLTFSLAPVFILTILSLLIWPCMQTRYTLYCSFGLYPIIAFTTIFTGEVRERWRSRKR